MSFFNYTLEVETELIIHLSGDDDDETQSNGEIHN